MWQMLRVYGDGRKLSKAVQCLYVDIRAFVRISMDMSVWFSVLVETGLYDFSIFVVTQHVTL